MSRAFDIPPCAESFYGALFSSLDAPGCSDFWNGFRFDRKNGGTNYFEAGRTD